MEASWLRPDETNQWSIYQESRIADTVSPQLSQHAALELGRWWQVAQRRVEPLFVVDLLEEAQPPTSPRSTTPGIAPPSGPHLARTAPSRTDICKGVVTFWHRSGVLSAPKNGRDRRTASFKYH